MKSLVLCPDGKVRKRQLYNYDDSVVYARFKNHYYVVTGNEEPFKMEGFII